MNSRASRSCSMACTLVAEPVEMVHGQLSRSDRCRRSIWIGRHALSADSPAEWWRGGQEVRGEGGVERRKTVGGEAGVWGWGGEEGRRGGIEGLWRLVDVTIHMSLGRVRYQGKRSRSHPWELEGSPVGPNLRRDRTGQASAAPFSRPAWCAVAASLQCAGASLHAHVLLCALHSGGWSMSRPIARRSRSVGLRALTLSAKVDATEWTPTAALECEVASCLWPSRPSIL